MNFLVLGEGPEELAWARALADHPEHRLWAACPGFKAFPDLPGGPDLDEALATFGVEAVIAGGGPELRAEGLRRAAAVGLPVVALHPPGDGADAYYQVALSHQETGAIIVPDLPARRHPGVASIREAMAGRELGGFRGLRLEVPVDPTDGPLVGRVFPRVVDAIRALLGEVDEVTATGDPPGPEPTDGLLVQLRGADARRAEVRLTTGPIAGEPARLALTGERGTLTLEFDPGFLGAARLVRRLPPGPEQADELEPWNPHAAVLDALVNAVAGLETHPDLTDGIRTLEIAQAVTRSLRRGRTIDLHYEEMSEAGNFKSVMTSSGCTLLLLVLVVLPASLLGPTFGLPWTIYLAYLIPPALVFFLMLQTLRFLVKTR